MAWRLSGALFSVALWLACSSSGRPFYGPRQPAFVSPLGESLMQHAAPLGARTPSHRLILIGDAGEAAPGDAVLAALGHWSDDLPRHASVVFLGDNLYPRGLGRNDERGQQILLQQLRATSAPKTFVPGNHDWGDPWFDGATLSNEERFIDGFAESPAALLPKGGCPGPALATLVPPGAGLERGVVLLALDLDWWLLDADDRPACAGIGSEDDFVSALERALGESAGQHVVVVAHHPLRSGGPHGGYGRGFGVRPLLRLAGVLGFTVQDLDDPTYRGMSRRLLAALASEPPLLYASGHDHSLQVLEGRAGAATLVVSGAGSAQHVSTVTAISGTLFAHAHPGFVVLDFYGDADFGDARVGDRVMLRVIEAGRSQPVFEMELPQR
jgi:Calcineurin-like phosphoesterase